MGVDVQFLHLELHKGLSVPLSATPSLAESHPDGAERVNRSRRDKGDFLRYSAMMTLPPLHVLCSSAQAVLRGGMEIKQSCCVPAAT